MALCQKLCRLNGRSENKSKKRHLESGPAKEKSGTCHSESPNSLSFPSFFWRDLLEFFQREGPPTLIFGFTMEQSKRVSFRIRDELGHFIPTALFARRLIREGFHVVFWVEESLKGVVTDAGFEYFEAFSPKDSRINEMLPIKADLCVFDSSWHPELLLMFSLGVPTIILSTCYAKFGVSDLDDPYCPLSVFPHLPPTSVSEWASQQQDFASLMPELRSKFKHRWQVLLNTMLRLNTPLQITVRNEGLHIRFPRVPRMVLAPRALDFPGATLSGIHCGSGTDCVYVEKVPNSIVMSFGSQTKRYKAAAQVVQHFLDVFAAHPAWKVKVGFPSEDRLTVPSNVELSNWIPQSALVSSAALLITHGGLSSLKESLGCGTPVLVVPFDTDQPGNGARVVFHKVGIVLQQGEVSFEHIEAALQQLLDPASIFSANAKKMSQLLDEENRQDVGVKFIAEGFKNGFKLAS